MTQIRRKKPLRTKVAIFVAALFAVLMPQAANAFPVTLNSVFGWTDTSGAQLKAHSSTIFQAGSTYYLIGDDMGAYNATTGVYNFGSFECYSSPDLKAWTHVGSVLTASDSSELSSRIVTRAHVIYNASTSKYVLYATNNSSSYTDGYVTTATSTTPCGHYTYQGRYRPAGYKVGDESLFEDSNGNAYVIFSDYTNFATLPLTSIPVRIVQLNSDYLSSAASPTVTFTGCREALEMVKRNGVYYLAYSTCTGWASNDNLYRTTTSLGGTWSSESALAPPSGSNTYDSQIGHILALNGPNTTSYLYIGDRFVQAGTQLNESGFLFAPLTFGPSNTMSLHWYDSVDTDAAKGRLVGTASTPVDDATLGAGDRQFDLHGAWATDTTCYGCYQDTGHYSTTAGDYYQVRFTGSEVRLYQPETPYQGIEAVSIDGGTETQVNLYSATGKWGVNTISYTGLSPATQHTLKVRVVGQKGDPSALNDAVEADQATVTEQQTVNDQTTGTGSLQFNYSSSWTSSSACDGCFGGDEHYTNTANATYSVAFTGTGISVLNGIGPLDGYATFSIDGGSATTVDMYSAQHEDNYQSFSVSGLTRSSHTLTVTVLGTHNSSATNSYVGADRVLVAP